MMERGIREERSEKGQLLRAARTVPHEGSHMGQSCRRSCCSHRGLVSRGGWTDACMRVGAESEELRHRGGSLPAWGSITHIWVRVLSHHFGPGHRAATCLASRVGSQEGWVERSHCQALAPRSRYFPAGWSSLVGVCPLSSPVSECHQGDWHPGVRDAKLVALPATGYLLDPDHDRHPPCRPFFLLRIRNYWKAG